MVRVCSKAGVHHGLLSKVTGDLEMILLELNKVLRRNLVGWFYMLRDGYYLQAPPTSIFLGNPAGACVSEKGQNFNTENTAETFVR